MTPSHDQTNCPTCGTTIPENAPAGLCPKCLLAGASGTLHAPTGPDPRGRGAASRSDGEAQEHGSEAMNLPPQAPEDLQKLFPELEIGDLLGKGGMGAVYRARQPRLNRDTALKILACPSELHDTFALRFEREAQTLARLNHPNIVTIYDFGERDGVFYFLMEFVEGTDLNQLIRTGKLDPREALQIVPQLCDALQYAHDEGVTHRDIKPANILIGKRGLVRVADFGLAKLIGNEEEALATGLTMTGTSMGTPQYMAPEQWESPEKVDHRSDIYSLGVVFYEMLTGERPAGVFKPPSVKSSEIDERLDTIVLRAMDQDPAHRYQQANEVKDGVTQIIETPEPGPSRAKPEKRRGLVVAIGVVMLIGIGIFLVERPWSPPIGQQTTPRTAKPDAAGQPNARPRPRELSIGRYSENPGETKPHRLVLIPTDSMGREQCPGAPWDVERSDIVDLQINHPSINGNRGPPLDHGVTVALTADGKLLDWINTIPGKSIIPEVLRDGTVAQFSLAIDGEGKSRSVAMLSSGKILTWIWKLDPENQSVTVSAAEELRFERVERPTKLRSAPLNGIIAIYEDGGFAVDPPNSPHFNEKALEGKAGVKEITANYLALLQDGTLVDALGSNRSPNPGEPLKPLPLKGVRFLRNGPYFPTALLDDGTIWHWDVYNGNVPHPNFHPTVAKAREEAPVVDFRVRQSGDQRFSVKNAMGHWYVCKGDLNDEQRAQLKDASIVYRDEHYVIGLVPVKEGR